ncbi:hypothetical protein [Bradyrhizobium acaciae]|uniref:hypothetical protein n=1 Tax=Bradyrhizobium acaciae TaxID=2683706 RepID=UPI001E2AF121|nr:hypothetical protein [Bradyrhizobium acaciae]MCC8978877.1 hypothetical protein [Bradyrhizobium acaciae]
MTEFYPLHSLLVRCPHCQTPFMVIEPTRHLLLRELPVGTDGDTVPFECGEMTPHLMSDCHLLLGSQSCCNKPYFVLTVRIGRKDPHKKADCSVLFETDPRGPADRWVAVGLQGVWTVTCYELSCGPVEEHWIGPFGCGDTNWVGPYGVAACFDHPSSPFPFARDYLASHWLDMTVSFRREPDAT